ncbi:acid phosphatase [Aureococcus anophagefferens]|nr:acid phosphatase [Aureococcus anophagefferens]
MLLVRGNMLVRAAACAGAGLLGGTRRCSALSASPSAAPEGYELLHVSCYFRHGARTPLFGLDTPVVQGHAWDGCAASARLSAGIDAGVDDVVGCAAARPRAAAVHGRRWQRETVLPGGGRAGELTAVGLAQAEGLGRRLRSRYAARLGADDPPSGRPRRRTTHVARCALTLRGVLVGLGASGPVDADAAHASEETLTPNLRRCDRLNAFWQELRAQRRAAPPPDKGPVAAPWGLDVDELQALDDLAAAEVATLLGVGVDDADQAAVLRLGAGPLVAELGRARGAAAAETPTLRLMSGHDTTVKPLLVALDMYDHKWPPFCACVALEVYKTPHGRAVRVLYDGATAGACYGAPTDFYVALDFEDLDAFLAKLSAVALEGAAWSRACGGAAVVGDAAGVWKRLSLGARASSR